MKHLIILSLLLISCEKEYITDPFIGSWDHTTSEMILVFECGYGAEYGYDTNRFIWEATDMLRLTWDDGRVKEFSYSFVADTLILVGNGITYKFNIK